MLFLFALLTAVGALTTGVNKEQMAEISFYDHASKLHTAHLQYYIDTAKVQFGVKFGVMLYKIQVVDCKPVFSHDVEEYFAAYIHIEENCNPQNILAELENHGADFIFVNTRKLSQTNGKLMSNNYPIPVFFIENNEDVFQLESNSAQKQYINIFFLMVN
jgi:hypothetical protein